MNARFLILACALFPLVPTLADGPVTRLPTFLDFSTWKEGMEHVGGTTWVEVCSSAAARALSAGLGENVIPGAFTAPDEFEDSEAFTRVTGGRTIAFEVAIRDANARAGRAEVRRPDPSPAQSMDALVEVEPAYVTATELKKRVNAAGDRIPPEERLRLEGEFRGLEIAWGRPRHDSGARSGPLARATGGHGGPPRVTPESGQGPWMAPHRWTAV
ncbi:MAG: hypothetical protein HY608_06725 [Planctomycetes bacterium]|nr:hypothetical protein [Planctomycetota bacterium]